MLRSPRKSGRNRLVSVLAVALLAVLTACSGDDPEALPTPVGDKNLTVGGGRSTEMLLLESMYGQLLTAAGYTVDYKVADTREIYGAALATGEIDVVPDYAATAAEYWNQKANGADAEAIATADAAQTVTAMRPVLAPQGLTVLEPSGAVDQNGFAVPAAWSAAEKVTTLSQLAARKQPVVLAGTKECSERPFCAPGLQRVYGLTVSRVLPTGFGTPETKQSVLDGAADLGLVGTTDGTLPALGLVLLTDDKKLQLADNVVPVVNTVSAGTPEVAKALDVLAPALTTGDLANMIVSVDVRREDPVDVARDYLVAKKLLS